MEYIVDAARRSGYDRRAGRDGEKRDRRHIIAEQGKYIGIIQKIPIFKGLKLDQFRKILRISSKRLYHPGEAVIQAGTESRNMFILIKGMLEVVFPDGKELSRITPVELVGEMGLFTGEQRSASVIAVEESIVLAIHRKELMNLFRKDGELGILILTNVIRDISHKLKKSNTTIEELKKVCNTGQYTRILSRIQDE